MVVYVDDINIAGPKEVLPEVWKRLRDGMKIGPEGPVSHFLGCTHEKGEFTLANGVKVTSMTYNMEASLHACVDTYLSHARSRGFNANLRHVPTPFIGEDQAVSPQGAPCGTGQALYCPACRHAFPMSESVPHSQYRATMRALLEATGQSKSPEGPGPAEDSRTMAGGETNGGIM